MLGQQQPRSYKRIIILFILLCLALPNCGSSHEDRQAKKDADRKERIQKSETEEKRLSDHISEKYKSVSFPPEGLNAGAFTFELQKFFAKYAERHVLFKGYLEDIVEIEKEIVVEFLCPLDKDFIINETAICFRLNASEAEARQLLEKKREVHISQWLHYISGPKYYVVAKINGLMRTRRYQFSGWAHREEVEINVEVPPTFVSTGTLIEAVRIKND